MLLKNQVKQYSMLSDWFDSFLGAFITDEFLSQITAFKDLVRGDTLLQLGQCGNNTWLQPLSFTHKWIAAPFVDPTIDLESSLDHLPLSRNSLDCVLLPLALEPFGSDLNLIDEIDRVLKPNGFIIILGINPWSLWGAAMKSGLLHCFNNQDVKLRAPYQITQILTQRGYIQHALSNFCYIPPVNNKTLLQKLRFFNEVGKMLWPYPSGLYCYIAQKQEYIYPYLIPTLLKPAINQL